MHPKTIHSVHNARVKAAARLRRSTHRARQGKTLVDGIRELTRALEAGVAIGEAYYCPVRCGSGRTEDLLPRLEQAGCQVFQVSPEVFAKLAYGERAEGWVGVVEPPRRGLPDLVLPANPLIAVLEGVEKPGNVGAMVRTADAAGLNAVLVADGRTDLFNPNAVRASLGTLFSLPVCAVSSEALLPWLRGAGMQICAARVDGERLYSEVDFRIPTALVLGAEAAGLSPAWQGAEIVSLQLPMCGVGDSLNVSAAAAVLFYEARRQRGWPGAGGPQHGDGCPTEG